MARKASDTAASGLQTTLNLKQANKRLIYKSIGQCVSDLFIIHDFKALPLPHSQTLLSHFEHVEF